MGCYQNNGSILVIGCMTAPNIYIYIYIEIGVPKWDPNFGNNPYDM